MKNLKIGVKILIGFLAVIAMMLVIMVFIIITNLQSIENVKTINSDSELQRLSNELLNEFYNARIPANKMVFSIDTSHYEETKMYITNINNRFKDVYDCIARNPVLNEFKPYIQDLEVHINSWIDLAIQMGEENLKFLLLEAKVLEYGPAIAQYANSITMDQLELFSSDLRRNASASEFTSRLNFIEKVTEITNKITAFRMNTRKIIDVYDTDLVPATLDIVDEVLVLLEEHNSTSVAQSQKEISKVLIDTITGYREALFEFGELCKQNDASIAKVPAAGKNSMDQMTLTMNLIDAAVGAQVGNTSTSAVNTLIIVVVISIFSIILAIIMATIIMRSITAPIKAMHKVIDKVATTGSFVFTEDERQAVIMHTSESEIGQSIGSFVIMMNQLMATAKDLDVIAHGDLSVSVKTISPEDTMGNAVVYMLDNLNSMFERINEAGEQVNSGSDQVSSASQSLAQGATEQASSIQQLSASIQEISVQVNENSSNAEKAFVIANETGDEVKNGNEQMQNMLGAMNDINNSSNEISKIIKVIDDIAFQTNILALNAAVEAARAGEAGKGFAVVADEVRNLASKSADAAKQTTDLIAGSVQSVGRGAEIAKKTAQSLELIEQKAKEVNQFISEITSASREQAEGVKQINIGVEQISSVIQTNSATAEQSAAAAEELSSQAAILNEQIASFKLR